MSNFINESEIAQLSEGELRAKLSELFNALALRQQEQAEIETSVQRIRVAIYLRCLKIPGA